MSQAATICRSNFKVSSEAWGEQLRDVRGGPRNRIQRGTGGPGVSGAWPLSKGAMRSQSPSRWRLNGRAQ